MAEVTPCANQYFIRNEGEQIVTRHNTEWEYVFGRTSHLDDSAR